MSKTIAAVATAHGVGGVAIIRISGDDASFVADKIFKGKTPVSQAVPYLMQYGKILDFSGGIVDSVMCVYMRAPHSFTGEDIVEIHCHGGILVTQKILELVLRAGAQMAEPGEFTKRAFLNGKFDLSQAEAVADLINAETDNAACEAVNRMEGELSKKINSVRDSLLDICAQIMVVSDYPEEDIDEMQKSTFRNVITDKMDELSELLKTADVGRFVNEGIFCTIVGKPNTGKSSLLNALLEKDRAIVTDIEGTTRDVITEEANIDGIVVKFCDTAGIREAEGIEKIGIEKSYEYIEKSDICLVVCDASDFTDDDKNIIEKTKEKKRIIVLNKQDLANMDLKNPSPVIKISVKKGEGLKDLKKAIVNIASDGEVYSAQRGMISNLRQKEAVIKAHESLKNAQETLDSGFPPDLAATDLENAISFLGEITGLTVSEEIINKIFSKFCLGK